VGERGGEYDDEFLGKTNARRIRYNPSDALPFGERSLTVPDDRFGYSTKRFVRYVRIGCVCVWVWGEGIGHGKLSSASQTDRLRTRPRVIGRLENQKPPELIYVRIGTNSQ